MQLLSRTATLPHTKSCLILVTNIVFSQLCVGSEWVRGISVVKYCSLCLWTLEDEVVASTWDGRWVRYDVVRGGGPLPCYSLSKVSCCLWRWGRGDSLSGESDSKSEVVFSSVAKACWVLVGKHLETDRLSCRAVCQCVGRRKIAISRALTISSYSVCTCQAPASHADEDWYVIVSLCSSLRGEGLVRLAGAWVGLSIAADCGSKVRSFVQAMGAATSAAPPSVIAGQYATSQIVKRRWSWVCSCKRRYSKFTTFTFLPLPHALLLVLY